MSNYLPLMKQVHTTSVRNANGHLMFDVDWYYDSRHTSPIICGLRDAQRRPLSLWEVTSECVDAIVKSAAWKCRFTPDQDPYQVVISQPPAPCPKAAALREFQRALDGYASAIHCRENPAAARERCEKLARQHIGM